MATVNLWELITTVSSDKRDLPNRVECESVIRECSGAQFVSELTLNVSGGTWTIDLFCHDGENSVSLTVRPNGYLTVSRNKVNEGIKDERTISF